MPHENLYAQKENESDYEYRERLARLKKQDEAANLKRKKMTEILLVSGGVILANIILAALVFTKEGTGLSLAISMIFLGFYVPIILKKNARAYEHAS